MPQPSDAFDLRRAPESALLDALEVAHPLALAEAYHRTVPAAHAVARRLMSAADDIESLLLAAYTQLWESPPSTGPLEGWIRRTIWTLGIDRLRASATAPASPSLAGLVPDLPAPDVRFLDAAERAIAELPDNQRRALLLAHDKGVPSGGQESGAALALSEALLALAGPETASGDRSAMLDDPCDDLIPLGDWCLGVASSREEAEVNAAVEERPGCAARSRTARRGRRRIEGLPATPDMGQRILVSVLTSGGRPAVVPPVEEPVVPPVDESETSTDMSTEPAEVPAPPVVAAAAADPFASLDETGPLPLGDVAEEVDPFAPPADDPLGEETSEELDPFMALDDENSADVEDGPTAVVDTAELDAADDEAGTDPTDTAPDEAEADWRPDPGSTAELRLSDILAQGDDDDPFSDLDDDVEEPAPTVSGSDPYSALRGLDDDAPAVPTRDSTVTLPVDQAENDEDLVGGYVEGQEAGPLAPAGSGRMAGVLAWILPIIGGSAIGILIAISVFGLPS